METCHKTLLRRKEGIFFSEPHFFQHFNKKNLKQSLLAAFLSHIYRLSSISFIHRASALRCLMHKCFLLLYILFTYALITRTLQIPSSGPSINRTVNRLIGGFHIRPLLRTHIVGDLLDQRQSKNSTANYYSV